MESLLESQLSDYHSSAKKILNGMIERPEDYLVSDYPNAFRSDEITLMFKLSDDLTLYLYNSHFAKTAGGKLVNPDENEWRDEYEIEISVPSSEIENFLKLGMEYIKTKLYPIILHEIVHYLQSKSDIGRVYDARYGTGGPKNFPAIKDKNKYHRGEYKLDDGETLFSRYMNSYHEIQSYVIQLAEQMNIEYPNESKFAKLKKANETELYKRFKKYLPDSYLPRINKMILKNLTDVNDQKMAIAESILEACHVMFK